MTGFDPVAILTNFGVPGVVALLLAYAYGKKYFYTGREYQQVEEARASDIKRLEETILRERQERAAEKIEMRNEITYWRESLLSVSKVADHVVDKLEENPAASTRRRQP